MAKTEREMAKTLNLKVRKRRGPLVHLRRGDSDRTECGRDLKDLSWFRTVSKNPDPNEFCRRCVARRRADEQER